MQVRSHQTKLGVTGCSVNSSTAAGAAKSFIEKSPYSAIQPKAALRKSDSGTKQTIIPEIGDKK